MDGTHKRVIEAFSKGIDIHYLTLHYDQAEWLRHRFFQNYGEYLEYRVSNGTPSRDLIFKPANTLVRIDPLSASTEQKLRGFRGCVLVHPDTYANLLHPDYSYRIVQDLMINCNMRHKPWQP